jgi:N-methylhydantoinase A
VLELRGARTALVTTEGFRDVVEIARGRRPSLFDLRWSKPEPLVPRSRRFEVAERIGADGAVVRALDEAEVAPLARRIAAAGAESVAVCLINSYANPVHERRLATLLAEALPELAVSASCDVLPTIREYERTSTVCVNAYLRPLMDRYMGLLLTELRAQGVDAPVRIMQSNGGLTSVDAARERPVYVIESGPGAGVMAALELGRRHGQDDVIAFDMGGTTAKATLIEDGRAHEAAEYEVGGPMTASRLLRGGGYAVGAPAIDIAEVGAGGGSIFWIDAGGAPQVGPQSAGALPGPACYGRGGELATVTDANVVLGYLNPSAIGGGSQAIDPERAAWAIDTHVAARLGVSRLEAAWGVHVLANASMGRAVRSVSMQRGRDPRDFTLMAFGGSGPIHAAGLARLFRMPLVMVPPSPGLFSALGLIGADITHDEVISYRLGARLVPTAIDEHYVEMAAAATAALEPPRDGEAVVIERSADVRYRGQSFELTIAVVDGPFDDPALAALRAAFDAEYERTYGHALPGEPIELVTLRLRERRVDRQRVDALHRSLTRLAGRHDLGATTRALYFGGAAPVEAPVITRTQLPADGLAGPLLIEEMDSTIVIPPGCTARLTDTGSVLVDCSADD